MKQRRILSIIGFVVMTMGSLAVHAQEDQANATAAKESAGELGVEHIYGAEMMTAAERNEYRRVMRTLQTDAERQKFMDEHRKAMKERAWALGFGTPEDAKTLTQAGVTLSDCIGEKCGHKPHEQEKSFHNYLHYGG